MNRRKFISISSLAAAGYALSSCTSASGLVRKPVLPDIKPDERLLLINAAIVDILNGELSPFSGLLIQNGRIADLFTAEAVSGVSADRTIDLNNSYVMPGIINAHCHLCMPGAVSFTPGMLFSFRRQLERNAETCITHGVTTVRDMATISVIFDPIKHKIADGEIPGPRIVQSCALDVSGGYAIKPFDIINTDEYFQLTNTPNEAREAVGKARDLGTRNIKLFQQEHELMQPGKKLPLMNENTVRAVCEEAGKCGLPVAMHATSTAGFRKGVYGPVNSIEHFPFDNLPDQLARDIVDKKIFVVPTLTIAFTMVYESRGDPNWGLPPIPGFVEERSRLIEGLLDEYCEPDLKKGALKYFNTLSNPATYESRQMFPVPMPRPFTAAAVIGIRNVQKLHQAGVQFGCGNDGGIPFSFPGSLWMEMLLLEESGIPTAEVLRMATINNAKIIRMDGDLGTVEKGKIADLAVFKENPLRTVKNIHRPEMVFQGGRTTHKI